MYVLRCDSNMGIGLFVCRTKYYFKHSIRRIFMVRLQRSTYNITAWSIDITVARNTFTVIFIITVGTFKTIWWSSVEFAFQAFSSSCITCIRISCINSAITLTRLTWASDLMWISKVSRCTGITMFTSISFVTFTDKSTGTHESGSGATSETIGSGVK